jgi:hypothetical protein
VDSGTLEKPPVTSPSSTITYRSNLQFESTCTLLQQIPWRNRRDAANCPATKEALEGPMVREIELLAVSVVFLFLGACMFGVIR